MITHPRTIHAQLNVDPTLYYTCNSALGKGEEKELEIG